MKTRMGVMGLLGVMMVQVGVAHPGRTDANGGHNGPGGYHFHNGGSAKSYSPYVPSATDTQDLLTDARTNRPAPAVVMPARMKSQEELSDMRSRALLFRMQQATNGMPTSQYRLGMNYVEGTEGVKTNMALGVYWLRKSAGQGQLEAKQAILDLGTNAVALELPEKNSGEDK